MLKPATLQKVTFFHGCFSLFLNCINVTKSRKASHISCSVVKMIYTEHHTLIYTENYDFSSDTTVNMSQFLLLFNNPV